jgi:hypothetical protein
MKQNVLILGSILILLVSACAPQAAATASPVDVQHTAEAAAFTMVAQTQQAIPTNSPIPPTEAASPTPLPTSTPIPLPTTDPLLATATNLPGTLPPATVRPAATSDTSASDNCNKALTAWDGPTASLGLVNETRPRGTIILSLYVVTDLGECGYLTDLSRGPVGQYSAGAFVEGKQDFKVFGGFRITEGSWRITVRNDKILALGSCYPGC